MPTEAEELQAKEFLKRAEIRTMRKDLAALREGDALKERDKIARIKTLEEQLDEKMKADAAAKAKTFEEKAGMEEVLTKNEKQEIIAEKDLKNYATEEERQQIFIFESQRFELEKQIDVIDKEKDPALKLEKNQLLLQKRDLQAKLNPVSEQEKKLEDEQKFIAEKAQITTLPSEKKALESRRWDLDKEIQDVQKKRWDLEKQIQEVDIKVSQVDESSGKLVIEKNRLRDRILGVDKSLRDIYSGVMFREEEKRKGKAEEQLARREALSEVRAKEKEEVRRQQWSGKPSNAPVSDIPVPIKKKIKRSFEEEEEQRKKFLQDVERASEVSGGQQQQKSNIQ